MAIRDLPQARWLLGNHARQCGRCPDHHFTEPCSVKFKVMRAHGLPTKRTPEERKRLLAAHLEIHETNRIMAPFRERADAGILPFKPQPGVIFL